MGLKWLQTSVTTKKVLKRLLPWRGCVPNDLNSYVSWDVVTSLIGVDEILLDVINWNHRLRTHIVGRPTLRRSQNVLWRLDMCGTIAFRPSVAPAAGQVAFIFSEIGSVPLSCISHWRSLSTNWISFGSQKLITGQSNWAFWRAGIVGVIVIVVMERLQVVNVNVVALG